jgi:glutamate racemase
MDNTRPIGFFDSGVGGISVLKRSVEILPMENYIYYGDSKNAPYGTKDVETIKRLTSEGIDLLVARGCKAVVVACNTATSAAIDYIRDRYSTIPVIGIEPALKPAVESTEDGKILVLATPRTLTERKFHALMESVARTREIIRMPLPGLVEIIEKGDFNEEKSFEYLQEALADVDKNVRAVVLGCTHYPFVKQSILKILGDEVSVYDGSDGTARRLARILADRELLNPGPGNGSIEIINSLGTPEILELSSYLLARDN